MVLTPHLITNSMIFQWPHPETLLFLYVSNHEAARDLGRLIIYVQMLNTPPPPPPPFFYCIFYLEGSTKSRTLLEQTKNEKQRIEFLGGRCFV